MAHWRDGGIGNMAGSDDRPIEEWTLLEKLAEISTTSVGAPIPRSLGGNGKYGLNDWGTPLSKIAQEAFDEIVRLRGVDVKLRLTEGHYRDALNLLGGHSDVRATVIKPPPDPAAEGWTWEAWKRELDAGAVPGWAVCRFANRIGIEETAFVFGIVRGSFGIWRQPFDVCAAGSDRTEHVLTCLTHLRSGLGIGIFADREAAVAAAEIAERVCPGWETVDPDDRAKWTEVHSRTGIAWAGIGVCYLLDAHCHDQAGGTYGIYGRSPESINEGRPEKLS